MLEERLYLCAPHYLDAAVPYQAIGGGQRTAMPDEAPITRRYNEHVFVLTMEGRGKIDVGKVTRFAEPGDIVWLNTANQYAHGCAPAASSWGYLWVGVNAGLGLDAAYQLGKGAEEPVFVGAVATEVVAMFERCIGSIRVSGPTAPAEISAGIGEIIAEVLSRDARRRQHAGSAQYGGRLGATLERIRADIDWPWTIPDMARIAVLSSSQLHRLFKQHIGVSPITWLRNERINRSRRLLANPALSVSEVARQSGYIDPYHFSRDFRRLTGISPTKFRKSRNEPPRQ